MMTERMMIYSVDVDCVRSKVGTLGNSAGKKRLRV